MNVYEMYLANGHRAGFWVIYYPTWSSVIAHVVSVAGGTTGELAGDPPYFGNPPVLAEFWRFVYDATELVRRPDGSFSYVRQRGPRAGHWEPASVQRGRRLTTKSPRKLHGPGSFRYLMLAEPDLSGRSWDSRCFKIHLLEVADRDRRTEQRATKHPRSDRGQ